MKFFKLIIFVFVVFIDFLGITNGAENPDMSAVNIYYYKDKKGPGQTLEVLDPEEIDSTKQVKLIIHGWMGDRKSFVTRPLKTAYLKRDDVILLIAEWGTVSHLDYDVSRRSIEQVGAKFAETLREFMDDNDIEPKDVHLIGHSLGAHVAGVVGRSFNGELGRITGLDPAGPGFNAKGEDCLSANNAKFVDVIHTGIKSLGIAEPIGDVDFYPNKGLSFQPGCEVIDVVSSFSCSHFRAIRFFAESISLPENFQSAACDYDTIKSDSKSSCSKNIRDTKVQRVFLGENVDQSVRGSFYLVTNPTVPFGQGSL